MRARTPARRKQRASQAGFLQAASENETMANDSRRRLPQALQRLFAVMRKETIQRLRDKRTLALILAVPLIELFLFAYAVDLTADHLPTAVVDFSNDDASRAFINALEVSGFFDITRVVTTEKAVLAAIDEGGVRAGLIIPPNLASHIDKGDAQAVLILDGSDSFSVQSGYSAAIAIAQTHALSLLSAQIEQLGGHLETVPIEASSRVLYNPNLNDMVFVMPGLVAVLLQILAVNTTAQSIVREYELGTLEQILATPIRPLELVAGKLIPNVALVVLDQIILTILGIVWFKVPFRGSLWLFAWLSLLYIIAGLGLGMLISSVARTQKETQQLTGLLMMLSQLLTGFIYPRSPMPPVIKAIGNLIPLTYYIRIARGIITKGIGIQFMWPDVMALALYSTVVMTLAAVTLRKRLD